MLQAHASASAARCIFNRIETPNMIVNARRSPHNTDSPESEDV